MTTDDYNHYTTIAIKDTMLGVADDKHNRHASHILLVLHVVEVGGHAFEERRRPQGRQVVVDRCPPSEVELSAADELVLHHRLVQ